MKPIKIGRRWTIKSKVIPSYELYCTWGRSSVFQKQFGLVYPSKFETKHVEAYLKAKKNRSSPFNYHEKVVKL